MAMALKVLFVVVVVVTSESFVVCGYNNAWVKNHYPNESEWSDETNNQLSRQPVTQAAAAALVAETAAVVKQATTG